MPIKCAKPDSNCWIHLSGLEVNLSVFSDEYAWRQGCGKTCRQLRRIGLIFHTRDSRHPNQPNEHAVIDPQFHGSSPDWKGFPTRAQVRY
jgi:hypothetical protein